MVPESESLFEKKINYLGYVLTFRSLLRVFDFGLLALSLSTWTQRVSEGFGSFFHICEQILPEQKICPKKKINKL